MPNETTQTQDGITGHLATETDLASYDFAKQQLNAMQTPTFGNFSQDPNVKVYFVLQDGTQNDAINDPDHLTNVGILKDQLKAIAETNPNIGVGYTPGSGTEGRGVGTIDAITGDSYDLGIGIAYKQFAEQVKTWQAENPDVKVRVINVNFSRGAPEAAGLTQLIDRIGVVDPNYVEKETINQQTNFNGPTLIQPNTIAQAVLSFDPVATGEGSERDLTFADSVVSGFQINAGDEFRNLFPVTNLIEQGHTFDGKFLGVTTAGAHTNIGGSYLDKFLSNMNFNLAVTYINSLFEEPILSPVNNPSESGPVVHHSAEHQWFYKTSDERAEINDLNDDLDGVQKISDRDDSLASQFTYETVGGDGQGISTAGQYKILSGDDWEFARDFIYNNLSENDVTYFQNAKGETFVAIKEEKLLTTDIKNDANLKDASASLTKFINDNNLLTAEENIQNWFQKVGTSLSGWVDSAADFIKNTAASVGDVFGGISTIGSWVSSVFTFGESDKTPDLSTIDNTQLNLTINTNLTSNFRSSSNPTQTGNAIDGGDYQLTAPILNLNGDGVKNVAPYSIATDNYRPGNNELSSYINFNTQLSADFSKLDSINNQINNNSLGNLQTQLQNPLANITNEAIGARNLLNVDPVILDLNNDGIKLISYNNSEVTFDVDNDNKLERTGWVDGNDGILVDDKNHNSRIDNITETISEYYNPNDGSIANAEGKFSTDGLAALKKLDSNNDNKFNSADAKWNDLKVWQDVNEDGVTDAGELKTLTQAGVKEINLATITPADKERNEGNIIFAKTTYTTINGQTRDAAAVDFTTNPIGYEFNDVNLGKLATSEEGTKSLVISNENGATVSAAQQQVKNIFGNAGDDTIIGDAQDNWLSGGKGSDTLKGGEGDDILIIDAQDKQENIDGGAGRDIAIINSDQGVTLNLTQANIETAVGGNGDDVLIGGGTSNAFIDGGSGDDIIIGGAADDALAGSDGADYIDGGYGDDVIRGHRGNDILIGGKGDDLMDGGLDDDKLFGGEGNDILIGGKGNDEIDGGEGYDLAKYAGSYADFQIYKEGDKIKVKNLATNNIDTISNAEGIRFDDVTVKIEANSAPLAVADKISIANNRHAIFIAKADLLRNDIDLEKDQLDIKTVANAVGGSVRLVRDGDVITGVEFTPDQTYSGVMSFDYSVQDSAGNFAMVTQHNNDGTSAEAVLKARVQFKMADDPQDPLYYNQWYLSEINVKKVWEDYSGKGVVVGVFEQGDFNFRHQDLDGNVLGSEKKDQEFRQVEQFSQHKTTVAGVIAAEKNDYGIVGVAYNAKLDGYSWDADATGLANLKNVDIANNSWGNQAMFADNFSDAQNANAAYAKLLADSVKEGRDGLGTINVFAGGNQREAGDNVNYHNLQNSRFVITTGSINQQGDLGALVQASVPFSNPGAAILVSAPGSNIKSTGNLLENSNGSQFLGEFSSSQGTSFSAPIISGIVALMLEANKNLGYRDVQKILALSARKFEDPNTVWQENGATNWNGGKMHFSNDYGFGIVDAKAAVRLAETWNETNNFANEQSFEVQNNVAGQLADNGVNFSSLNIAGSNLNNIENVEVELNLSGVNFSDLKITLISPNGTRSVLMDQPKSSVYNGQLTFNFSSRNFLDEKVDGEWKLEFQDTKSGDLNYINGWKLKFYGKLDDGVDDVYVYTDEFAKLNNGLRAVVADSDGGVDAINASAVSTDSTINLNAGQISVIAGQNIVISASAPNAEYYAKQSELAQKQGDLTAKNSELQTKQNVLAQKQSEFSGMNSAISAKVMEYNQKSAEYQAAQTAYNSNPGKLWFENHTFLAAYGDGSNNASRTQYFYRNNSTGGTESIFGNERDQKINDWNNAANLANQKGTEVNAARDQYNALIARQNALPTEITNLGAEVSALSTQVSSLQSEVNFLNSFLNSFNNTSESAIENAYAGDGNDTLMGNSAANILYAGRGHNTLTGNGGNDEFVIKKNAATQDVITDLKVSEDKINLRDFSADDLSKVRITQDGLNTKITFESGQIIVLQNVAMNQLVIDPITKIAIIKNVLNGTDDIEFINGTVKDDILDGKGGQDAIFGRGGNDDIKGGSGNDMIYGGSGNNEIDGGDGDDSIYGSGDLNLNDFTVINIDINQGDNKLFGGAGNDDILGGLGKDYIDGGIGDDLLFGGSDDDTIIGGDGNDTIYGDLSSSSTVVNATTSQGGNKLFGGNGDDVIIGGIGENYIDGGAGNDIIFSENSNDVIIGGDGNNHIQAGGGNDIIDMGGGPEVFNVDSVNTAFGEAGSDVFIISDKKINFENRFDIIADFDVNDANEKIDLSRIKSINKYSDLNLYQDGNDAYILFNKNFFNYSQVIKLENANIANLNAEQFIITNEAPISNNDIVSTNEDNEITINILANDGDDKTAMSAIRESNVTITQPQHGSASVNFDGTITYRPNANYNGSDYFEYSFKDAGGLSSQTAVVNIAINPVNDAPVLASVIYNKTAYITKQFDFDVRGSFSEIENDAISYSATLADGSPLPNWINFDVSNLRFSGVSQNAASEIMLKLIATDSHGGSNATDFKLQISDKIIFGSDGDDIMNVTDYSYAIDGGKGNDVISGSYNNVIFGGDGNDIIKGGAGSNNLSGGSDSDIFVIKRTVLSTDTIVDFEVNNANEKIDLSVFGEEAKNFSQLQLIQIDNDVKIGFTDRLSTKFIILKNVLVSQLSENNFIFADFVGDAQNNNIAGNNQDNSLFGLAGDDIIDAGNGNDKLYGGAGSDILNGGDGDDILNSGDNVNDGSSTLYINFVKNGDDVLNGGNGNDKLYGDLGDDILNGGAGNNILTGGRGSDIFKISINQDGADVITDFSLNDFDKIDISQLGSSINFFDLSITQQGRDAVIAIFNQQIIVKNLNHYSLTGEKFIGLQPYVFHGAKFNDKLYANQNYDSILKGFDGNDYLAGYSGNDVLNGGNGDDELVPGRGNNILTGGEGVDKFRFTPDYDDRNLTATNIITDFNVVSERIILDGINGINGLNNLTISDTDRGAKISFSFTVSVANGVATPAINNVYLTGVLASQLSQNNFEFRAAINGTAGNDDLVSGDSSDNINGQGGNDIIHAGGGNDIINPDMGSDEVYAGAGDDTIYANDSFFTSNSDSDILYGEDGDDKINMYGKIKYEAHGGNGDDVINVGTEDAKVFSDDGNDTIILSVLRGYDSQNNPTSIYGGRNAINAGSGDDRIEVIGGSANILSGGNGDDKFVIHSDAGNQVTIVDFEVNNLNEKIDLAFCDVINFNQLQLTQNDLDTVINLANNQSIILKNVNVSQLSSANFIFMPSYSDGNDVIRASKSESLTGGVGDDIFVIEKNPNAYIYINDFEIINSNEKIQIKNFEDIQNFSDIKIEYRKIYSGPYANSFDAVMNLGDNQFLRIKNVAQNSITTDKILITHNSAPTAPQTQTSTNEDTAKSIDVLAAANDIDGDALSITHIGTASHGVASIITDAQGHQKINYTPNANFNGADSLTYTISDSQGGYATQNLQITVGAVNDAPIILSKLVTLNAIYGKEFSYTFNAANFSDIDGDELQISIRQIDGSPLPSWLEFDEETLQLKGTIPANITDLQKLSFVISDGITETINNFNITIDQGITAANSQIQIISQIVNGVLTASNQGADLIKGSGASETFQFVADSKWDLSAITYNSYNGQKYSIADKNKSLDAFDGKDGRDVLKLTSGDDAILLDDKTFATTANGARFSAIEIFRGNGGNDIIDLSSNRFSYGNVTIMGNSQGNDILWGNDGDDIINGYSGNDNINGGRGNDTLSGGDGNDILEGYDGDDIIDAGNGADKITGGLGADVINGGTSYDTFIYKSLLDSTISQSDTIKDFDITRDKIDVTALGFDSIAKDVAASAKGLIYKFVGDDTIISSTNSDFAITLSGHVELASRHFSFKSAAAAVQINGGYNISDGKNLKLTASNDNFKFDDLITQTVKGDLVYQGLKSITGGGGSDIIDMSSNKFSYGNLIINGNSNGANDTLIGNDGDDTINGYSGADTIKGGKGNDIINAGDGNDIIEGNAGNDVIDGGNGADKINGGLGADILKGGTSYDTFIYTSLFDSTISQSDMILGFDKGKDKIDLRGLGFDSISKNTLLTAHGLTYHFDGENTVINDPNSDFELKIAAQIEMSRADFMFA